MLNRDVVLSTAVAFQRENCVKIEKDAVGRPQAVNGARTDNSSSSKAHSSSASSGWSRRECSLLKFCCFCS